MSGGSLGYVYHKVNDAIEEIESRATNPLQRAFAEHLKLVSSALHDTEWVFSGDKGEGNDAEAIKAVLGKDYKVKVYDVLKSDAEKLIEELKVFIK